MSVSGIKIPPVLFQTRNYLSPDDVMKGLQGEIDEVLQTVRTSIVVLVSLRENYDKCRMRMDKYFTAVSKSLISDYFCLSTSEYLIA